MSYHKYLLLLCFLFSAFSSFSQSKKEKEVAVAIEKFKQAMVGAQKSDLENIASEKLKYGHSGGTIESKQQFVETFTSGRSDFVACTFSDIKITVSGKVAIATFKVDAVTNDNNKPGEVHMRLMTTWQKKKGKWKLLARQAVRV